MNEFESCLDAIKLHLDTIYIPLDKISIEELEEILTTAANYRHATGCKSIRLNLSVCEQEILAYLPEFIKRFAAINFNLQYYELYCDKTQIENHAKILPIIKTIHALNNNQILLLNSPLHNIDACIEHNYELKELELPVLTNFITQMAEEGVAYFSLPNTKLTELETAAIRNFVAALLQNNKILGLDLACVHFISKPLDYLMQLVELELQYTPRLLHLMPCESYVQACNDNVVAWQDEQSIELLKRKAATMLQANVALRGSSDFSVPRQIKPRSLHDLISWLIQTYPYKMQKIVRFIAAYKDIEGVEEQPINKLETQELFVFSQQALQVSNYDAEVLNYIIAYFDLNAEQRLWIFLQACLNNHINSYNIDIYKLYNSDVPASKFLRVLETYDEKSIMHALGEQKLIKQPVVQLDEVCHETWPSYPWYNSALANLSNYSVNRYNMFKYSALLTWFTWTCAAIITKHGVKSFGAAHIIQNLFNELSKFSHLQLRYELTDLFINCLCNLPLQQELMQDLQAQALIPSLIIGNILSGTQKPEDNIKIAKNILGLINHHENKKAFKAMILGMISIMHSELSADAKLENIYQILSCTSGTTVDEHMAAWQLAEARQSIKRGSACLDGFLESTEVELVKNNLIKYRNARELFVFLSVVNAMEPNITLTAAQKQSVSKFLLAIAHQKSFCTTRYNKDASEHLSLVLGDNAFEQLWVSSEEYNLWDFIQRTQPSMPDSSKVNYYELLKNNITLEHHTENYTFILEYLNENRITAIREDIKKQLFLFINIAKQNIHHNNIDNTPDDAEEIEYLRLTVQQDLIDFLECPTQARLHNIAHILEHIQDEFTQELAVFLDECAVIWYAADNFNKPIDCAKYTIGDTDNAWDMFMCYKDLKNVLADANCSHLDKYLLGYITHGKFRMLKIAKDGKTKAFCMLSLLWDKISADQVLMQGTIYPETTPPIFRAALNAYAKNLAQTLNVKLARMTGTDVSSRYPHNLYSFDGGPVEQVPTLPGYDFKKGRYLLPQAQLIFSPQALAKACAPISTVSNTMAQQKSPKLG